MHFTKYGVMLKIAGNKLTLYHETNNFDTNIIPKESLSICYVLSNRLLHFANSKPY